jgi:hypothetical protein
MNKENVGSRLDDLLIEEDMLHEATAFAIKKAIAWQAEQAMIKQNLTKSTQSKNII